MKTGAHAHHLLPYYFMVPFADAAKCISEIEFHGFAPFLGAERTKQTAGCLMSSVVSSVLQPSVISRGIHHQEIIGGERYTSWLS